MGRRNRSHILKISKNEDGIIKKEEILCDSLAEAHKIAKNYNEHTIYIYDNIDVLVDYKLEPEFIKEPVSKIIETESILIEPFSNTEIEAETVSKIIETKVENKPNIKPPILKPQTSRNISKTTNKKVIVKK